MNAYANTTQIKILSLVSLIMLIGCSVLLFLHSSGYLSQSLTIHTALLGIILFATMTLISGVIFPLFGQVKHLTTQLQRANTHDSLTGLNQRHTFTPLANQAIALSQRYQWQLSVIRFDIDHFKSINSQYGNQVGDEVIKHVALTIGENSRESDSMFRFDGEEFVLLLPQTNQEQALKLATKINQKVLAAPLSTEKLILEVSISGGVSECKSAEPDIEHTLIRADRALQLAKNAGRNQVAVDN